MLTELDRVRISRAAERGRRRALHREKRSNRIMRKCNTDNHLGAVPRRYSRHPAETMSEGHAFFREI
jgi:hypothetical protein